MNNTLRITMAATALAVLAGCDAQNQSADQALTLEQTTAVVQPLDPSDAIPAAAVGAEANLIAPTAPTQVGSSVIMPTIQGTGYNALTAPLPQAMPFTTALAMQESASFYQNGSKSLTSAQFMQDPMTARLASNGFPGSAQGGFDGEIMPADPTGNLPRMARVDASVTAQPLSSIPYTPTVRALPAPQIALIDQSALVVTNRQMPLELTTPIASADTLAAIPASVQGIQPLAPGQIMNLNSFATAQIASITTFPYSDPREESKIGSGLRGQALPKLARFIPSDLRATVLRDYGWDALDPASGFSEKMVIGAQIGTPVIAPAAGVISALKFSGGQSSITLRVAGVDFTFEGLEVPSRFRLGQPVSPNVILGTVGKAGKFEHSVHFLPTRGATEKNSANAINPFFANAYMI